MALIIEDGTGVANAVTYITPAQVSAFALARGITLAQSGDSLEPFIMQATDFFEAYGDQFKGYKEQFVNDLQFPRTDLYLNGYLVESQTIPQVTLDCLCSLTIDAVQGNLYAPIESGRVVKKFKLEGVLEKEYGDSALTAARLPRSSAILSRLLDNSGMTSFEVYR